MPLHPMNLDAEYDNRARVPDHPAVFERWRATAEAARAAHPPAEIAYGPGPRHRIDLFEAASLSAEKAQTGPRGPVVRSAAPRAPR